MPAYNKNGNRYIYRAKEIEYVYGEKTVEVYGKSSSYDKPIYTYAVKEDGKNQKADSHYVYTTNVKNKLLENLIPKPDPTPSPNPTPNPNPGPDSDPAPDPDSEPMPVPAPGNNPNSDGDDIPVINVNPAKIEGNNPNIPYKPADIVDMINDIIDLPDDPVRKEREKALLQIIIDQIKADPTYIENFDPAMQEIISEFLRTGVLGRIRQRLPQTGGMVGSIAGMLAGIGMICFGAYLRNSSKTRLGRKKRRLNEKK